MKDREKEKEGVITASINHLGQSPLPRDAGWIKLSTPSDRVSIHPSILSLSPSHFLSIACTRAHTALYKCQQLIARGTLTGTASEGKREKRDGQRKRKGMLLIHLSAQSFCYFVPTWVDVINWEYGLLMCLKGRDKVSDMLHWRKRKL